MVVTRVTLLWICPALFYFQILLYIMISRAASTALPRNMTVSAISNSLIALAISTQNWYEPLRIYLPYKFLPFKTILDTLVSNSQTGGNSFPPPIFIYVHPNKFTKIMS